MATIFNDTFTESVDTTLASHVPDVGTSWSVLLTVGTCTLRADASSDNCQLNTGSLSDGVIYVANATYDSADYYAQMTMQVGDSGDDYCIMVVRAQDANNMYACKFNNTDSRLYKKVSGTWTALGSLGAGIADGSVVKLDITGTTLTFYDDGVSIHSVTVTDHSSAGKAGIGVGAAITAGDDASGQEFDNFTVVTAGGGGGTPARTTDQFHFL